MIRQQRSFMTAGSDRKMSALQNPGTCPMPVMQEKDMLTAAERFMPDMDNSTANRKNIRRYRKKKLRTRPTIFFGTEIPLMRILVTMWGWSVRFVSAAAILNRIRMRMIFIPPVTEPMHPPIETSSRRKKRSKSGQSSNGAASKPVVLRKESM